MMNKKQLAAILTFSMILFCIAAVVFRETGQEELEPEEVSRAVEVPHQGGEPLGTHNGSRDPVKKVSPE